MSRFSYFDARRLARAMVREQKSQGVAVHRALPSRTTTPKKTPDHVLPPELKNREISAIAERPWIKEAVREAKAYANDLGIEWSVVVSKRRTASIVDVRHEIVRYIRSKHPHLSLTDMGAVFNRDHTSILSALRRIGFDKEAA